MAGIWAVGELVDEKPTRLTLELATLARQLGEASGQPAAAVVVGSGAAGAAEEVARYVASVTAVEADTSGSPAPSVVAAHVAAAVAAHAPDVLLLGATPDGKDLAGLLLGLTELPILVNGSGVTWEDGGPVVEMSVYGGRLVTRSGFVEGRGMILVRPASVSAEPADGPGEVRTAPPGDLPAIPEVRVTDRVQSERAAVPIEEARIIVGGGRGVGTEEGFRLIEELAEALGGAVGATRAVVDAGWIAYGQQIGQTGKIVKPALYVACGISGAIQHKVGVQTAGTIVAINKDPDAPIAEFADLLVVGDLFEVVPRLTEAVRSRSTSG